MMLQSKSLQSACDPALNTLSLNGVAKANSSSSAAASQLHKTGAN
jgi:hypothetical protein